MTRKIRLSRAFLIIMLIVTLAPGKSAFSQSNKSNSFDLSTDPYLWYKGFSNLKLGWTIRNTLTVNTSAEYASFDTLYLDYQYKLNSYYEQFQFAIAYKPFSFTIFDRNWMLKTETINSWRDYKIDNSKISISPKLELGYLYNKHDYLFKPVIENPNYENHSLRITSNGLNLTPSLDFTIVKYIFLDVGYTIKILFPKVDGEMKAVTDNYYSGLRPTPYRIESLFSIKLGVKIKL